MARMRLVTFEADGKIRPGVLTEANGIFDLSAAGLNSMLDVIEAAALAHEPHRIAFFLYELASAFHVHWTRGRDAPHLRFIILDDLRMTVARLALVQGVVTVLASGLKLLGVEAPEEMR